jgi:DNA-binding transcriptional ArsR family regulator
MLGSMTTERPARAATRITDPKALRALAHPVRLSLMGLLRTQGPLTATKAGELLGESSASASFHLRQLAKYGLVQEAGGGQGRERPWQAAELFTDVQSVTDDPQVAAAAGLLHQVVADHYFTAVSQWLDEMNSEPQEWQEAGQFGDTLLYLTAGELTELGEHVEGLLDAYLDRITDPSRRPKGARLVRFLQIAHPLLGPIAGEPDR